MAQKKGVMMLVGFLFLISLLLVPAISAAATQQYAKIFLNPFYKENLAAGVVNNYTLIVVTPDKIASVQNAIFSFNAQVNGQTQNFTLKVNNKSCNPASYMVATAYSTTGNVQFYYDCSNIVNAAGIYTVTLQSSVNTGAITGWLDLTYTNSPAGLTIHGTEYQVGDPGKVWLQLLDSDKTAIDNATCFMTMYTPNNLKLFSYLQMQHLDNGIYYFDFFAPDVIGVYPVIADCYYITSSQMSSPNNYNLVTGTITSGNINSLSSNDGDRLKISEQTIDGPGLDMNFTFTNITDITAETDMVIGLHGRWSGRDTDPIYIQIWNYTSGSWLSLPNTLSNTGGMDVDTSNVLIVGAGSNATSMGLIKNGNVTIRVKDANITDTDIEGLQIDKLWINLVAQGSTGMWANVKGSSEVHVNTNGGHFYTWETLCDDHNPACAVFSPAPRTPQFEQQWVEGLINETITVNNIYRVSLKDNIEYQTALGLDCTGVLSITETYNDGTIIEVYNNTLFNVGTEQNCKMSIPVEFEATQSSLKIDILSDNYPKWEVEWAKNVIDGMTPDITNYCNDVASKVGITYNLPINSTITSSDPEVEYCYRAMDDLWYYNNYYDLSQSVNTIGPYLSYLSQSRFYYPLIYNHYNHVKQGAAPPITTMVKVMGTDYQIGDNGRIFLQLLQSNNVPINNASCYATIYYPNSTVWQSMTGMTYQTGSSGLYYLDFNATVPVGIYMVDTVCSSVTQTFSTNASAYVIGKGWYFGGTPSSLTSIDNNFLNVSEKNFNPGYVNTTVTTLLMAHLDEGNGTSSEDTSTNPATGTTTTGVQLGVPGVSGTGYYYPVGSFYTNFPAVSKFNLNSTEQYMVCFSFNESTTNANGNRIVDSAGGGSGFRFSFDGGNLIRYASTRDGSGTRTLNSPLSYLDSKWHTVCGYSSFTNQFLYIDGVQVATQAVAQTGALTSGAVTIGAISGGGGSYSNTAVDEVCYMKGTFGTGQDSATLALAYNTSKQCGVPNSSMDMNVTIPNINPVNVTGTNPVFSNIISTYIWNDLTHPIIVQVYNYTGNTWFTLPSNLTYNLNSSTSTEALSTNIDITQFLNGGNMTIRYFTLPQSDGPNILKLDQVRLDQTNNVQLPQPTTGPRGSGELNIRNYSFDLIPLIPQNVWGYGSKNLTIDGNTLVAQAVWNYSSRNLTYFDFVTQALFVWNSTSRNLTYFDYITQAGTVWNYSMRNLTYFDFVTQGLIVWNTTNRNLTYFDFATQAGVVWNSTNRSLTYYPDVTNYLLAAQTVWNYTGGRNLTYFDFVTAALNVWNATDRNLTYYQDVTNYNLVASTVWGYSSRNLTYLPPVSIDLNSIVSIWNYTNRSLTYYPDVTNYSLIAQMVWNYISRNLTYTPDLTNYALIQMMTWNATDRNLTYYQDFTNNSLTAQTVWNYVSRNLTYTSDATNYNTIQLVVWNATTRNLTYYQPTDLSLVPESVWNYTTRNLTYTSDVTDYNRIFVGVWNYTTRNLTYYDLGNNNNLSASDVWNYISRNLTFIPTVNATVDYVTIANNVWNNSVRNLTFYPTQTDLTNYTLIGQVVWNFSARNLTYYNLGNNLSSSDVWNYISRNLTYYQDVVNYTQITENIWSYNNRTLTYYQVNNISTYDIWNYVNRSLTENVSQEVWMYYNRTLTGFDFNLFDNASTAAVASAVWNFTNRSLTEDIPFEVWTYSSRNLTQNISYDVWTYYNKTLNYYPDVTNYSLINDGVWTYNNRSLTYYADVTNYTNIGIVVWGYTGTISPNILNQFAYAIWNYVGSISVINNQIANAVWQFPARYTHGEILD